MKDELISRQAAIKAIKEDKIDLTNPNVVAVFKATGDFEKAETQSMTCDRHIEILKDLPSAQPGWIPCKTALPEHDGEYLVTIKAFAPDQVVHTDIDIARFTDGKWRKGFPVTAWCELPKPWKGEQGEGND